MCLQKQLSRQSGASRGRVKKWIVSGIDLKTLLDLSTNLGTIRCMYRWEKQNERNKWYDVIVQTLFFKHSLSFITCSKKEVLLALKWSKILVSPKLCNILFQHLNYIYFVINSNFSMFFESVSNGH